jgi:hypothetical protein
MLLNSLIYIVFAETKRPQHMGKQKGPKIRENKKAPTHGKTKRPQDTGKQKGPVFWHSQMLSPKAVSENVLLCKTEIRENCWARSTTFRSFL